MSNTAYLFNMTENRMYVTVNGSGPELVVAALSRNPPYNTLGTPEQLPRSQGSPKEPGHFSDLTSFTWHFEHDSKTHMLEGVQAPENWDVELDVQVYFFKNSVMVRYGDNATYFTSAGFKTA